MSAYIVDDKTISAIAKAFYEYRVFFLANDFEYPIDYTLDKGEECQRIGQVLLNQNYRSVNYRYSENTKAPPFEYEDVAIDEGIIYGCIECYEYQACETKDYYHTALHFSLVRLKEEILESLLRKNGLSAFWGYDGHDMLRD